MLDVVHEVDGKRVAGPGIEPGKYARNASCLDETGFLEPRVERQLAKVQQQEEALHAELAAHAADFEKLAELDGRLREVVAEREALEEQWLEAAEHLG